MKSSWKDLFIGVVLLIVGGYLLLTSIEVVSFSMFGFGLSGKINTTAVMIILFIMSVVFLFLKPNLFTKIFFIAALCLIILSVVLGIRLRFKHMDLLPLLVMLVSFFGGLTMCIKGFFFHGYPDRDNKRRRRD